MIWAIRSEHNQEWSCHTDNARFVTAVAQAFSPGILACDGLFHQLAVVPSGLLDPPAEDRSFEC